MGDRFRFFFFFPQGYSNDRPQVHVVGSVVRSTDELQQEILIAIFWAKSWRCYQGKVPIKTPGGIFLRCANLETWGIAPFIAPFRSHQLVSVHDYTVNSRVNRTAGTDPKNLRETLEGLFTSSGFASRRSKDGFLGDLFLGGFPM